MALKKYKAGTTVSPVPLTNTAGITRSANALNSVISAGVGVLDQVNKLAFQQGASIAKEEGAAAASAEPLRRDPATGQVVLPDDLGGNFTIYDRAYRQGMLTKYSSQMQTDIAGTLQGFAQEHIYDQASFQNKAESYLKSTVESVDPRVRGAVLEYGNRRITELSAGIGNRTATRNYQNQKVANQQSIELHRQDVISIASKWDDFDRNIWESNAFQEAWGRTIAEIDQSALFVGDQQAQMAKNELRRGVHAQLLMGKFIKIDNEVQRAEVLSQLAAGKGSFIDGTEFASLLPNERQALSVAMTSYHRTVGGLETAENKAHAEQLAAITYQFALKNAGPAAVDVMANIDSAQYKPTALLSFVAGINRIQDAGEIRARRNMNNAVADLIGKNQVDAAIAVAENEGFGQMVKALAMNVDHLPASKQGQIVRDFLSTRLQIEQAKDRSTQRQLSGMLIQQMKQFMDPATLEQLDALYAGNPDLFVKDPQLAWNYITTFQSGVRSAAAERRRLTNQARVDLARAEADKNYSQARDIALERLEQLNPAMWATVMASFENPDRDDYVSTPLAQANAAKAALNHAELLDTEKGNRNYTQLLLGRVATMAETLGLDMKNVMAETVGDLSGTTNKIRSLERWASSNVSAYNTQLKFQRDMAPYIQAVSMGTIMTAGKKNGQYVDAMLAADKRAIEQQGGTLDINQPSTWLRNGYINAGIPESGVQIMKQVMSNNPENRNAALGLFRELQGNSTARYHMKAQLGADLYGKLEKLSEYPIDDLRGIEEEYKAIMSDTRRPSEENLRLIPDVADAEGNINYSKVDTNLRELMYEVNDTIVTSPEFRIMVKNVYGQGSLGDPTHTRPPEGFYQAVKKVFLASAHLYKDGPEAAMEAAISDVLGGPEWGWSRYAGAVPGVGEDRGDLVLMRNPIEKYYAIHTIDGPDTDWIMDAVLGQIKSLKHPDYKDKKLRFQKDIFLVNAGMNAQGLPLYTVGLVQDDVVTDLRMTTKDGSPLLIDISDEFERRKIQADNDRFLEKANKHAQAERAYISAAGREINRQRILRGGGVVLNRQTIGDGN